jgi:hypothetical protein
MYEPEAPTQPLPVVSADPGRPPRHCSLAALSTGALASGGVLLAVQVGHGHAEPACPRVILWALALTFLLAAGLGLCCSLGAAIWRDVTGAARDAEAQRAEVEERDRSARAGERERLRAAALHAARGCAPDPAPLRAPLRMVKGDAAKRTQQMNGSLARADRSAAGQ